MWKYLRSLRKRGPEDERPLPYVDPLRAGRHPFQVYMLALCVVSGAPYLFGKATAEAIEVSLPVYLALAWGVLLFFGALTALIGSFWRGAIDTGLTMERVGLSVTGGAALVYAICIAGARSGLAPVLIVGLYLGYYLLRVPVPTDRWSPQVTRFVENCLAAMGMMVVVGLLGALFVTPALPVLVSVFVILGFGLSCLRRARDLAAIFQRAKESHSLIILREGETSD